VFTFNLFTFNSVPFGGWVVPAVVLSSRGRTICLQAAYPGTIRLRATLPAIAFSVSAVGQMEWLLKYPDDVRFTLKASGKIGITADYQDC